MSSSTAQAESLVTRLLVNWRRERAKHAIATKIRGRQVPLQPLERKRPLQPERPRYTVACLQRGGAARRRKAALALDAPEGAAEARAQRQHALWSEHVASEMTALNATPTADAALVAQLCRTIDRHGCWMRVERSRDPSAVGAEGIVLAETSRTFQLVCNPGSRVVMVLKPGSVFRMHLPQRAGWPEALLLDGDRLLPAGTIGARSRSAR